MTTLSDVFIYVRRKLKEWREAKGISYKRPPMPVKGQVKRTEAVLQPFWITMKEEDDAHSLICAVDRSLADCIKLLEEVSLISFFRKEMLFLAILFSTCCHHSPMKCCGFHQIFSVKDRASRGFICSTKPSTGQKE